ncbi:MAG: M48 family metalloprotease [Myxococcota bacterium]
MKDELLAAWVATCLALACAPRPAPPVPDSVEVDAERRLQYGEASALMLEYWSRAADVTSRVRIAGAELCGDKIRAALGIVALSNEDLPRLFGQRGFWRQFRVVFEEAQGITDRVRVLHVAPRAPADAAGLRAGDIVVSLAGRPVRDAGHLAILQSEQLEATYEMEVSRAGSARTLTIDRVAECWYDLAITVAAFPNAFADGRIIYATTGLLRTVESDDELALVIGHELAHNVLGHSVKSFKRSEQEADYLGCYFAALAGYDVAQASPYWRRVAREFPVLVSENASYAHSGTATRAAALARTVEEIRDKLRVGAPLVPNASP